MCGPTRYEAPANLTGGIEFTLSKRSSASDGITRSAVCRSLGLEQDHDSLGAVRRPRRYEAAISFAQ